MQERHKDRKRYFEEEAETCTHFYIPYITPFLRKEVSTVLEVGCGEGGNLMPFAQRGIRVTGIDIDSIKTTLASKFFNEFGLSGTFVRGDFLRDELPHSSYDIILSHDVIEHIHPKDKLTFMKRVSTLINSSEGIGLIAFPAWHMPYGGHQQMCHSRIASHLPWIHLLPASVYRRLLRSLGETEGTVRELLEIKTCKMTVETMEKLCNRSGLEIVARKLWLINPHYKVKFGLPPISLPPLLSELPYLRNYLSTSCFFLVRRSKKNTPRD